MLIVLAAIVAVVALRFLLRAGTPRIPDPRTDGSGGAELGLPHCFRS